ncbi:MAG TPA: prolyl oligopeptidase family serine peptidase [Candidatus Limnocylindria bacterium]
MPSHDYPTAPTSDQFDDHHGQRIADPYRPLEDSDAPATRDWIEAENALTERVLAQAPERGEIRARLGELWDHPRAGAPWRRGHRWFQLRNTGLQDQDVLWMSDAPGADGVPLLDPNELSDDGTAALSATAVSESGQLLAYAISDAGSDWRTWRIRRTSDGEDLPDALAWSKFASATWTHDDAGFFYGRYPEPPADAAYDAPNHDMQLRYHRLGTDPADDRLVFATPEQPEWVYEPEVTDDGRLLVVSIWRGTDPTNRVHVADLSGGVEAATVRPLLDEADARYELIDAVDGVLFLLTDRDAPRGRVVAVDVASQGEMRELIPEGPDTIESVRHVGGRLAAVFLRDAHHRLAIFETDGHHVVDVALPGIGKIGELAGRSDDDELQLTFMSFAAPARGYAVAMSDGTVREVAPPDLPWDPDAFVTEQVFVTSADGTRLPLFLSHRRGLSPSGEVPTLLYGYGGFQISVGPIFKPEWLAWMERGGLLAVASLRGGGEYGRAWHDAGRLAAKQNVFDDFAACARWLASSGWTRPERIGVSGRSNGGLLVGATITQHPELVGAAIAEVGVMDMLRFHRFTIGWGWTSDYGSADDPEQFRTLLAYSPLHNIRPGRAYPPTLVTTGDHDDRVVPGHSFKFAAALQAAQAGEAPILIRIDTDAGHGVGKPVSKLIDERADVLAFLELAVGPRSAARPTAGVGSSSSDPKAASS